MKPNAILIRNALLIDGVRKEPIEGVSVLIENKKIKEIGKSIIPPEGSEIIAAEGKTVMPGMIDCHVHLVVDGEPNYLDLVMNEPFSMGAMGAIKAVKNVERYLPAGFTAIRDAGSPENIGVSIRNAINAGRIEGPRVLASGRVLSITGGHCDFFPPWVFGEAIRKQLTGEIVDGREDIRKVVRRQLVDGVDSIKFCATGGTMDPVSTPEVQEFSDEEMETIIEEANRLSKRTLAHAQGAKGIKAAIRAGVGSIDHGFMLDDECIKLMKEMGTFLVPTLSALYWEVKKGVESGIPEVTVKKSERLIDLNIQSFKKAVNGGVKVAMGTDAGSPFNKHGDNAFELELMVKNGMTEMDAIIASTRNASENLGISDKTGTIEEGKLADIIIINGNPLQDICLLQNKEKIETVIKEGAIMVKKS